MSMKKNTKGLSTVIEIFLVLMVVMVLVLWLTPKYVNVLDQAQSIETMRQISAARTAVEMCILETQTTEGCDSGTHGIP